MRLRKRKVDEVEFLGCKNYPACLGTRNFPEVDPENMQAKFYLPPSQRRGLARIAEVYRTSDEQAGRQV